MIGAANSQGLYPYSLQKKRISCGGIDNNATRGIGIVHCCGAKSENSTTAIRQYTKKHVLRNELQFSTAADAR